MADQKTFARDYLADLAGILPRLDTAAITRAIECLRDARDQGRTICIAGNGGSATAASHMVVDIVKGVFRGGTPRFKMLSLTDSIATITAYANDLSYEAVFVEQLKNWAGNGDVFIGVSGSGNSKNVLLAAEYANSVGCTTIGLTTGEGGKLKDICTIPLVVPSKHMGRLEDTFFIMTHILCYAFMEDVY